MNTQPDGGSGIGRPSAGRFTALRVLPHVLLVLVLAFWPRPSGAEDQLAPPDWDSARAERAVVVAVLEAGVLLLDDGRQLVPAALRVPRSASPGFAEGLNRYLDDRLSGRAVLFETAARTDRHGRIEAQIVTGEGLWLQAALAERGLARVAAGPHPQALLDRLLKGEERARRAGLGLWADPAYRLLQASAVPANRVGRFQVIEGLVLDGAVVRGRGYLNFGADWREDFTVMIPPRQRRAFAAAGRSVEDLKGRRVRVRGWLDDFNGPMIEVRYPSQIEVLVD